MWRSATRRTPGAYGRGVARSTCIADAVGKWVAVKDDDVLVAADTPSAVLAWLAQHDQTADSMFRVPENEAAADGAAPT